MKKKTKVGIWVTSGVVAFAIIGGVASGGDDKADAADKPSVTTSATSSTVTSKAPATSKATKGASRKVTPTVTKKDTPKATKQAAKVAPKPAKPALTNQQQNAVRSAENYLSFKGFSRQGLIDQLSSEYGEGFSAHNATVAVNTLNTDWNAQAVKSAKQYLEMKGFSCNGLIDQLNSAYGEKFTLAQARYGAQHAGAC